MKIINFSEQQSIINQYMAELRDKSYQRNRLLFRNNIERVGEMMAYELSKTLEYKPKTVTTPLGTLEINLPKADTTLDVSVSDTGCGIADDMLTRILDPFVQVLDPSHSADRAGGTGLGLSICRSLVEVMGGELVVESELGKGSTFRAIIPGVATTADKLPSIL